MFDLLIIGAGPAGISAAFQAKKLGLKYLVIEKELIGNTVYNYPVGLTVFSTINELEFEEGDLKPAREKPTREELLSYYVRFVLDNELNVQTEELVETVEQFGEHHFKITSDKGVYEARNVLFAIGAMDHPRKLNVKGEDLSKVHDTFRETYPWVKKKAMIVGGGNSAGEAALFLTEEGAETTLAIFRDDWEETDPKQGCIKYWVKNPLEEQLKKRCLNLFFLGKILEIREKDIVLEDENGKQQVLENDVVFVLIGSDADLTMLTNLGVETEKGKYGKVPVYDEETFETNISGIYVVGHFTKSRHIKAAIEAPKTIIPKMAEKIAEGLELSSQGIESNMTMQKAKEILKHQFGYDSFRMNQSQAIENVLAKKDCVVLMPTGGGKSLCYQIPALMLDGLTLVVSPLIALMKDQVDALVNNGINAAFLNSTQTGKEQVEVFQRIRNGELKLLYVAPERLMQSGNQFIDFLKTIDVSLFAIDEAHCISSWGHDFRPEYRQLAKLKQYFPGVPLIGLTATADKLVRKDIIKYLTLKDHELLISSFNRPNIYYTVKSKRNSYPQLIEFLRKRRGESGIIYCLSRKSTENLAKDLRGEGFEALPYHAGLDKETRQKNQELFLNDEAKIIVATIAFGMGIDKSNVRFVVHMDLPKNVESYYQETGRAGRDGLESDALMFFSWGDVVKLKGFAEVENNQQQTEIMLKKLTQMGEYGDMKTCRRKFLLQYFDEELSEDCGHCDNCNTTFETFDGTIIAQKALSAVVRTGQSFGLTYLIDFIRGSKSKKIRLEHLNLKTYGVGADSSKEEWFAYFKDLISQGIIAQTEGQFPSIVLTEKSEAVLLGKTKVKLFTVIKQKEKKSSLVSKVSHPYIEDLFHTLKRLRLEISRLENVPPYVVFSDATLVEFATYLPQNEREMLKISGVGDVKMHKYGAEFLGEIVDYCEENNLNSRIDLKTPKRKTHTKRNRKGDDTYDISLKMFKEGKSVSEIAKETRICSRHDRKSSCEIYSKW